MPDRRDVLSTQARSRRSGRSGRASGLPGLFDVHVHFLPPNIQRAVYAVFDAAGPKIGREWPIRYRVPGRGPGRAAPGDGRTPLLGAALRPPARASRRYLNDWARGLRRRGARVAVVGDLLPRARAPRRTSASWSPRASRSSRSTCRWGSSTSTTRCSTPVWGLLEDAGTPIVVHAGSGPVGNAFTGPDPLRRVLERFPRLARGRRAHGRAGVRRVPRPRAERYERVCLDTTMVFTDFFGETAVLPARPAAPARRPAATRCCWAPTSRRSPTPTPTSSRAWPGSTWATTGCARSAGTTAARLFGATR